MGRKKAEYSNRELAEGRNFECVIYPDSESYDCDLVLNRLSSFWDSYFYILHDKDFYTEKEFESWHIQNPEKDCPFQIGELKKPHYHVIGHMKNDHAALILHQAAVKFGIDSNYVQKIHSLRDSIKYLIHQKQPDKFQYEAKEIITNDIDCLEKNLKMQVSNSEKAKIIVDLICSGQANSVTSLATLCLQNDCWDELRRGQHIYTAILIERKNLK